MWHRLSFRTRLVCAGILVQLLAIALLTWNSVDLIDDYLHGQFEVRVSQDMPLFNAALAAPMAQRDYSTVQAILRESRSAHGFRYLIVSDNSERVLVYEGWQPGLPLPDSRTPRSSARPDGGNRYDFVMALALEGLPLGSLRFGLSGTALDEARGQLLRRAVAVSIGGMVLFSLLLAAVAYFLTRPLARLTEASRQIHAGNYDIRLPPAGKDEIGDLTEDFGHMAAEVKRRVAELEVARHQAELSDSAKSQFLASMSHEIRTPLNGVLGMVDLLHRTPLNEQQRRYCDAIASSGRALRDLLGDILDLSKIEAGKVVLEEEDFDPSGLLADLLTVFRDLSGARGNTLQVAQELPATLRLRGDAMRLRQVLTNLLGNAVKFTENGRIKLRAHLLEARAGDSRQWLRFTVKDTGIGMTGETLARLFQPFTQADTSTTRQYGGTGLGLAISRQLVELMGGTIEARSSPSDGTEFGVELPFAPARSAAAAIESGLPTTAGASLSLLLVEDNEINQEVALAMLEGAGHRVEVAGDGAQAVSRCATGRYNCVLMDCQMPGMDGFEATRRIRARETGVGAARVPIVALTANAMTGDRERCLAAGMDDFLSKPFDSATLVAAVARNAVRVEARAVASTEPHMETPVSFDPAALEELISIDCETPGFLVRLTARYLDSTPELIAKVVAVTEATAKEAERAAHSVKSTSLRFGAFALGDLAARAEVAARERDLGATRNSGEAMRLEFARAAELLQQHPAIARKVAAA